MFDELDAPEFIFIDRGYIVNLIQILLTNELRLILGLFLVSKLAGIRLGKKAWPLAVFLGCSITILQAAAAPAAGILAAEILIITAIIWYYQREQLRLCLFLIFFYEIGIGLWDFLLSAGLGILFHSNSFLNENAPNHLIGIWLARLLMLGVAIRLEKPKGSNPFGPVQAASVAAILALFGTITLSEQTILPIDENKISTWTTLSLVLLFAIMFYRLNRQREMELEIARLKQEQAEILERDYEALSRTYADNAKLYHDLLSVQLASSAWRDRPFGRDGRHFVRPAKRHFIGHSGMDAPYPRMENRKRLVAPSAEISGSAGNDGDGGICRHVGVGYSDMVCCAGDGVWSFTLFDQEMTQW